jgi:hypothetical protein
VNRTAGWAIAAVGVVLALVAIWIDSFQGSSYWSDGTTGVFLLIVAGIAGLALLAAYAGGQEANGWAFAAGAVLFGFYGFLPAATAFDFWKYLDAGAWLGVAGGGLIMIGVAAMYLAAERPASTPAGTTSGSLAAALGVALVFPAIFVDSLQGASYWTFGAFGHSIGIVLLIIAIACGLVWAAAVAGTPTSGIDQALTLVLLGLLAVLPVGAAFGDFGSLDAGAWLGLAGGILAAGGTWSARGGRIPYAAPAPA